MSENVDPRKKHSLVVARDGAKLAFRASSLQIWIDEVGLESGQADGAGGKSCTGRA